MSNVASNPRLTTTPSPRVPPYKVAHNESDSLGRKKAKLSFEDRLLSLLENQSGANAPAPTVLPITPPSTTTSPSVSIASDADAEARHRREMEALDKKNEAARLQLQLYDKQIELLRLQASTNNSKHD